MAGEVRDIQTVDGVKRQIDYNYLANRPSIPTKTSDLQNDSGFITSLPSIPTKTSELQNDSGFITSLPSIPTKTSDLQNDSGFITSVPNATSSQYGTVKVDNDTIKINSQGQLYVGIQSASGVSF